MKICLRLKEVAEVLRFCRAVKPSGSVAHVLAQFPPPVNNSGGLRLRSYFSGEKIVQAMPPFFEVEGQLKRKRCHDLSITHNFLHEQK